MEHIGNTTHFKESGYTEWLIPINKPQKELPYPIITIRNPKSPVYGKSFYLAKGVKSNKFLQEAEFKTRDKNLEEIKKKIDAMIEEVCK